MKLSKSLIKADIIAANQAIEYYESNNIRDIKNIAAYHLQQAAEKLIKIQVYNSGVKYDNKSLYTHNIKTLILYAESLNIGLVVPDYIRKNSSVISDWEAGSRYDVGFSIRIDVLKKTADVIGNWIEDF
jgi:HEPN domain-containing protein